MTAKENDQAFRLLIGYVNGIYQSITFDNSADFVRYEYRKNQLKVNCYFAKTDHYFGWRERNKHTNVWLSWLVQKLWLLNIKRY